MTSAADAAGGKGFAGPHLRWQGVHGCSLERRWSWSSGGLSQAQERTWREVGSESRDGDVEAGQRPMSLASSAQSGHWFRLEPAVTRQKSPYQNLGNVNGQHHTAKDI
jgi:hypothetical protein